MFLYLKATLRERWVTFIIIIVTLTCLGAGFMATQSVTDKISIEADEQLQDNWRYQYDLLVQPSDHDGEQSIEGGWVSPQSSMEHYGGISIEDWETIKTIDGVEVAAPIALLGYFNHVGISATASNAQAGNWYRTTRRVEAYDGFKNHLLSEQDAISEYYDPSMEGTPLFEKWLEERGYPTNLPPGTSIRYPNEMLIVAIDPQSENQLYRIKDSMVEGTYLDRVSIDKNSGVDTLPVVPVIGLEEPDYEMKETVQVFEIDVPDNVTMEDFEDDPQQYLRALPQSQIAQLQVSSLTSDLRFKLAELEFDRDTYTLQERERVYVSTEILRYSPLEFELLSDEEGQIPQLKAKSKPNNSPFYGEANIKFYRELIGEQEVYDFTVDVIGLYDATNMTPRYAGSWQTGDPVDIYTPHHSMIIKNGLGEDVDPSPLLPLPVKASYYPGAPDMLTTLEVLDYVYDDQPPLSSIRIVVEGVEQRTNESQQKIERVANEIRDKTGHHVDVMLGSSASKVHVHLAGDKEGEVGVVEESWQKKGMSWSIETQINRTNLLLFVYLLIISIVFCYTITTHSLIHRSIDFAMLRSIGWTKKKISQILMFEVIVLSMLAIFAVSLVNLWGQALYLMDYFLFWIAALIIIALGYVTGSRKALNVSPSKGLEGEGTEWRLLRFVKIYSIMSYVMHQLLRRPLRFVLLVAVVGLTTFMIVLSVSVQQSLSDYLYLSFLGEAIDLELAGYQEVLLTISITLATIVTLLLIFLNLRERKKEFFIFHAIGWSRRRTVLYTNLEALIVSLIGSVLGVSCAAIGLKTLADFTVSTWLMTLAICVPIGLIVLFSNIVISGLKLKNNFSK
ncbi:ABC transporter permease [Lentibacillus saliphilus]|uniref:ABC transporter permease n=1 Tax=Lentibacillus saliphilus TaxID=2737028 RepID=UPI001C2FBD54|nr:FtsX-like permease family protein [Lentibacillus saliphilus]